MNIFPLKLLFFLCFGFLLPGCTVPVFAELAADELKDITLEWVYQKEELGIKPIDPDLPRQLKWSAQGHILAYLVSSATEAPNLVFYNPARNATAFTITPSALHNAIIKLASCPGGVSISNATTIQGLPEDATAFSAIEHYEWLEDSDSVRLQVEAQNYIWNLQDNRLMKDSSTKDLPEGERQELSDSPNKRFAAYIRANNLFVYDREQKKEIQLTQDGNDIIWNGKLSWVYWEELHMRQSWRAFYWSPDSRALAYLQFSHEGVSRYPITDFSNPVPSTRNMFYPKAGGKNPSVRLGIVSLSTRTTRWIDLGEPYEYIARVEWHPDGKILAVQVLNRDLNQLRLLFIDTDAGSSRMILEETDEAWVFPKSDMQDYPIFLKKDNSFLWISERSGFQHLYQYSMDGTLIKTITEGEWSVNTPIQIDEQHQTIYFTSNREHPLDKHVYKVSLNDAEITQLTHEPGMHSPRFSSDYQYFIDTFNNQRTPNKIQIMNSTGETILELGETTITDYAPYRILFPEILEIPTLSGEILYGSLMKPADFDPARKYPVIMHIYSGPGSQIVWNTFGEPLDMAMVNQGFLVFRLDPFNNQIYGMEKNRKLHRNLCDSQLNDLQTAVEFLESFPYVARDHIGIWGWSFGGYMTCCALLKTPDLFQAGAAVAPVTDWRLYDTIYTEYFMDHPDDNPEGYRESSPVQYATQLKGSLFLAHGISDDNVHIQNTYQLVDALTEAGKDYELYVYPEGDHGIGNAKRHYHLFSRMFDFFKRELQ
ncbi:MAG: S9 family peptidase [bacterium]|jgi:dipeptidyl-peptidase-4